MPPQARARPSLIRRAHAKDQTTVRLLGSRKGLRQQAGRNPSSQAALNPRSLHQPCSDAVNPERPQARGSCYRPALQLASRPLHRMFIQARHPKP